MNPQKISEIKQRAIIAECPEFIAIEDHSSPIGLEIVRSESVELAYWSGMFRIIDRKEASTSSKEERVAWALAIVRLAQFTRSGNGFKSPLYGQAIPFSSFKGRGGIPLACRLAHTIGRKIIDLHAADAESIDLAINDCAALFKNSLRAYAAAAGMIRDNRSKLIMPLEVEIILAAGGIFSRILKQPSKSEIRTALECQGVILKGNDQQGRWNDAFSKAALSGLPDSPAT